MDQSQSVLEVIRSYGGSDSTTPSFNRQAYVKYNSIHAPKDFGVVSGIKLDLEGLVGAQSGTQTLFFSFTILEPARIGLRRIRLNPYTDQYISIGLRSEEAVLQLGFDGFVGSELVPIEIMTAPTRIEMGYTTCGYWETGYAVLDCQFRGGGPRVVLAANAKPEDSFESPFGSLLPPGKYTFTVSNSQWVELPYRIQVAVVPEATFEVAFDMETSASARLSRSELEILVTLETFVEGRIAQDFMLSTQIDMEASVKGNLDVLSPYG